MTKKDKIYLLYTDVNQTKLIAAAYSLQQAKEESLNYNEGQWFSYKEENRKLEYERKVNIKFGTKVVKKEIENEKSDWNIGGSNIR